MSHSDKNTVNNLLAVILASSLFFTFAGCTKKEEKVQTPPGHPGMQENMPMTMSGMQKKERTVVISKEVKEKWAAVKLSIADKAQKTTNEYTVTIGSELAVPNTKMTVSVLAFLPDFKMSDKDITSASNKPNNPAVKVLIRESGKEEWKGWLFSSHSEIHPFPHDKISIKLMGGVTK